MRAVDGWTAIGERFAAGGATVEQALMNYWKLATQIRQPVTVQLDEDAAANRR
jgi:hypothetical protein